MRHTCAGLWHAGTPRWPRNRTRYTNPDPWVVLVRTACARRADTNEDARRLVDTCVRVRTMGALPAGDAYGRGGERWGKRAVGNAARENAGAFPVPGCLAVHAHVRTRTQTEISRRRSPRGRGFSSRRAKIRVDMHLEPELLQFPLSADAAPKSVVETSHGLGLQAPLGGLPDYRTAGSPAACWLFARACVGDGAWGERGWSRCGRRGGSDTIKPKRRTRGRGVANEKRGMRGRATLTACLSVCLSIRSWDAVGVSAPYLTCLPSLSACGISGARLRARLHGRFQAAHSARLGRSGSCTYKDPLIHLDGQSVPKSPHRQVSALSRGVMDETRIVEAMSNLHRIVSWIDRVASQVVGVDSRLHRPRAPALRVKEASPPYRPDTMTRNHGTGSRSAAGPPSAHVDGVCRRYRGQTSSRFSFRRGGQRCSTGLEMRRVGGPPVRKDIDTPMRKTPDARRSTCGCVRPS